SLERDSSGHTHPAARPTGHHRRLGAGRHSMSADRDPTTADMQALVDAIVDALVERGLIGSPTTSAIRVVSAGQLAELLRRDRRWVYAHAQELGGFRYGDGPKARLGFDLAARC